MESDQSSYRQIVKATSLFGGVRVAEIFITILRTKFVAVLLGPYGMGFIGLLNSTLDIFKQITELGLSVSAVKDVSIAHATGNHRRISVVIKVLRRLVWATGIAGTLLVLVTAPVLSEIAFGDRSHTLSFVLISITLLLGQLATGRNVILQGTRRLKYLAKASVLGSFLGMLISVPLYYFFGTAGIVPAIIITSFVTLSISWYYSNKIVFENVKVKLLRAVAESKAMVKLGFLISINGVFVTIVAYIIRIFISNTGGIDDVGFYNAGFAVVNSYVGMIFSAISTDYYPRLAAVTNKPVEMKRVIDQQAEIALLMLGPLVVIFLVYIDLGIIILYTSEFLAIEGLIHWAMLGVLFKAGGWCLGFLLIAKGDSSLFFWSELVANSYTLGLTIALFSLFGITGLGIAFLAVHVIYLLQMIILVRWRYGLKFGIKFMRIFMVTLVLSVTCFAVIKIFDGYIFYLLGNLCIILSLSYSLFNLGNILNIKDYLKKRFNN